MDAAAQDDEALGKRAAYAISVAGDILHTILVDHKAGDGAGAVEGKVCPGSKHLAELVRHRPFLGAFEQGTVVSAEDLPAADVENPLT